MKKNIVKIISLTFAILMILISPLGSYVQGKNAYVYAAATEGITQMSKYLFPIAAYYAYQIQENKGLADSTKTAVQNTAAIIEELNDSASTIWNGLSLYAKARIYKFYTDLSNYEINELLNTTFSDSEFLHYEQEMINLQSKIANDEALTSADLQGLGVYKILANYLGQITLNPFKSSEANLEINNISGVDYVVYTQGQYSARSILNSFDNSDFIRLIGGLYTYKMLEGNFQYVKIGTTYWNIFNPNLTFKLVLSNNYYLKVKFGQYGFCVDKSIKIFNLNEIDIYNTLIFEIYNIETNELVISEDINKDRTDDFIEYIAPYCSTDILSSKYYTNYNEYKIMDLLNLNKIGTVTYSPTSAYAGDYNITDIISTVIDPSDVGSIPDTSLGQAERVIAAEASTTSDTNIQAEEDEEGTPTIIVTPSTGIAETSNPADEGVGTDNPEGVFEPDGTGWIFRIPILGTILKVLMDLFNLIKNWFQTNPTTGSGDTGIDWGNFKGFFDIFYIFYYLIIIVILILLKFLAAVMNMMSIPANTALFDSYPTMLSGLNYIKGIKVGGFSITLQQIFDYMFTVFFFLFVVTVLQKLYHSFSSVERQQAREDREIKYKNSDYENIHYEDRR